ncbi:Immunoglobulin [Sergentomyia squamirostris]
MEEANPVTVWKAYLVLIMIITPGHLEVSGFTTTNEDYPEMYDAALPNFATLGQHYDSAIGSTLVLPCKLNLTTFHENFNLVWKKDEAVLTAGPMKLTMNPRISLVKNKGGTNSKENSYNLEIQDIKIIDTGKYICQLSSIKPREVIHSVQVLVPPKIVEYHPSDSSIEVKKGASFELECRGSGTPPPRIIWMSKQNILLNGQPEHESERLFIESATRNHMGTYTCSADNNVSPPASKDFEVFVLFAPEVEVEHEIIYTGLGREVTLVCKVYAQPPATVHWFKDTIQQVTTDRHIQEQRGNRNFLNVRIMTDKDLGNYTCQASNGIGKERKSIIITGSPERCLINSRPRGPSKHEYNITWSTMSFSPIIEYYLYFRENYSVRTAVQDDMNDNFVDERLQYRGLPFLPSSYRTPDGWIRLTLGVPDENRFHPNNHHERKDYRAMDSLYTSSYMLRGLQPSAHYEAKVEARNMHGWSESTPVFYFTTASEDSHLELSAQPAISKNADGETNRAQKLSFSALIVMLFYFVSTLVEYLVKDMLF